MTFVTRDLIARVVADGQAGGSPWEATRALLARHGFDIDEVAAYGESRAEAVSRAVVSGAVSPADAHASSFLAGFECALRMIEWSTP